jgi:hypothetical protein
MGAISLARLPGRLIHTDGAAVAVKRDATDSPNTLASRRMVSRLGSVTDRSTWLNNVADTPA